MKQFALAALLIISATMFAAGDAFSQTRNPDIRSPKAQGPMIAAGLPNRNADAVSSDQKPATLTEGFVFYIQDFKFQHQSELNNLNIKFQYTYRPGIRTSQYPDFQLILNDVKAFLQNYPDEEAYWEILNKDAVAMVLQRYPVLSSVTSELQVSPSAMIPFLRASVATRQRPSRSPLQKSN